MLPMMYAPIVGVGPQRLKRWRNEPQGRLDAAAVWEQAFKAANRLWTATATDPRPSSEMREIGARNAQHIGETVAPLLPVPEDPDRSSAGDANQPL